MYGKLKETLQKELQKIKNDGLYKEEWEIISHQGADIKVKNGEVINFCANNYLGLAGDPKIAQFAKEGTEKYGYGMSSVRFICGTQDIHRELEHKVADFLHTDDSILYSSCFDANGGLFHVLLDGDDAIISDALNHASIIDGIRLCKANRFVFKHADMENLEKILKDTQKYALRLIATDGIFSMDGDIAKLDEICALAEKYDALVMIDDAHSTGFFGKTGRGTPEYRGVEGKIDIITSTFGKALGGASGGFTTGRKEIIDILRQRSRPYLFSNTLAPPITYTALKVLDMLEKTTQLRDKLEWNTKYFRKGLNNRGFKIKDGTHPIIPIMLGEEKLAHDMARDMLTEGIYVVGFSYPVVPMGQARIRVQMSAAHDQSHLDSALNAFEKVGKKYKVI